MATRQLTRSSSNRIVAGVAGGIAAYTGWDLGLIRLIWALVTLFSMGTGIIVYLLLWIVLPDDKSSATGMDQILSALRGNSANSQDTSGDPHPNDYR